MSRRTSLQFPDRIGRINCQPAAGVGMTLCTAAMRLTCLGLIIVCPLLAGCAKPHGAELDATVPESSPGVTGPAVSAESKSEPGQASEFASAGELYFVDGSAFAPFADSHCRIAAFVFIATDCPIANAYHPELAAMQLEYEDRGVSIYLVHSTRGLSLAEAKSHVDEYKLSLPVVMDRDQHLARQLGAAVTPEVIVLTRTDMEVAYRGAIDNLYADYGKKRRHPTELYLRGAIESLLAGQQVSPRETKPIGCYISFDAL